MVTITISGRRWGKTAAAAQAAGMSIDAYRELMRQQHERLDAARALAPIPPARDFFRALLDEGRRSHSGHEVFMREYMAEFESPGPEPVGPPAPTFEQWEASQRAQANADRWRRLGLRGYRWEFTSPGWD